MIFRYTAVPGAEPTPPNGIEAPAMPAFQSALADQVETVEQQVEALEAQFEKFEPAMPSAADTTLLVAACCTQSVNTLQTTVDALTPLVPQFLRKYRNVNLVIAGLQFLGIMPDHLAQVKAALKTLRQARGPTATATALTELSTAIDALTATTRQAFQRQPMQLFGSELPASSGSSASTPPSGDESPGAPPGESVSTDSGAVSQAEAEAKRKLADEATKKLKDAAKKKLRIGFP